MTNPAPAISVEDLRRERERRAWLTMKATIIARVVNYGARLLVIPLSIKMLGKAQYGLWLTAGSLVSWLGMSDFGLSRGLVNAIAEAADEYDRAGTRRLLRAGSRLAA